MHTASNFFLLLCAFLVMFQQLLFAAQIGAPSRGRTVLFGLIGFAAFGAAFIGVVLWLAL